LLGYLGDFCLADVALGDGDEGWVGHGLDLKA
jgi:hypothetical protein